MTNRSLVWIGVPLVAVLGVGLVLLATRGGVPSAPVETPVSAVATTSVAPSAALPSPQPTVAAAPARPPAVPPTPAQVSKWSAAATGDDAQARDEAINGLATAPKSEALPPLKQALLTGSPEDQKAALDALGNIAVAQGDADGAIQDILREAIYHGVGGETTARAQTTLDAVQQEVLPAANN